MPVCSICTKIHFIKKVGVLKNVNIDLHLIQNSDFFGVYDSIDGIIALAWEDEDSDSILDNKFKRLVFHYGDSVKTIEDKLYERDIVLNYEKSFSEYEQR